MTDFEKLLSDSLKSVRDEYRANPATDVTEARRRFLARYRRRKLIFYSASAAFGTAVLAAIGVFALQNTSDDNSVNNPAGEVVTASPSESQNVAQVSIPVEGGPSEIVVDGPTVWVASESGHLTRIDSTTNRVVERIRLGGNPRDIEIGIGGLWIANPGLGAIQRYDPDGERLRDDPIVVGDPGDEIELAVRRDTIWAVVGREQLLTIVPSTGASTPVDTGGSPVDVTAGPISLWVVNEGGIVNRLNPEDGSLGNQTVEVGGPGEDVTVGTNVVWVGAKGSDILFRIDIPTKEVLPIQLPGDYVDLAVGETVWALTRSDDGSLLTPLAPATGEISGPSHAVAGSGEEVASSGGSVWVAESENDRVVRVDVP